MPILLIGMEKVRKQKRKFSNFIHALNKQRTKYHDHTPVAVLAPNFTKFILKVRDHPQNVGIQGHGELEFYLHYDPHERIALSSFLLNFLSALLLDGIYLFERPSESYPSS